jgi:FRG domain
VFQFLDGVQGFAQHCGESRTYFRAESAEAGRQPEPQPSIGRGYRFLGRFHQFSERDEKQLLSRFRRRAYEFLGRVPTVWESIIIARHHGLPVRLLDWTANPLVALYFAAHFRQEEERKAEADIKLWAISGYPDEEDKFNEQILNEQIAPLEVPGIKLVYPFSADPRITRQSGCFTIHPFPWEALPKIASAGTQFKPDELDIEFITSWTIRGERKAGIMEQLCRMDITARTVFPDLDGLAEGLCQELVLRGNPARQPGKPNS